MQKLKVTKKFNDKKIILERVLDAPRDAVWRAWTEKDILEKWWAPMPWQAITKSFEFKEGGRWHYYMRGPKGEISWGCADFISIDPETKISVNDFFCDEDGKINSNLPIIHWENTFTDEGMMTKLDTELVFKTEEDMNKLIEMGFEEGFSTALDQLDKLLSQAQ